MDFSTMKDKIINNEYNTVTEFKVRIQFYNTVICVNKALSHLPVSNFQADFKLMCDNATVYNRPETVYYKAAKKLLHTGFKMMSKVIL